MPDAILLGTMIHDENGDPLICTTCWICGHHHASEGSNPSGTLKTIHAAEKEFLRKDRERDHVAQYWRKDVAGLYALAGSDGTPIKLIELSTASADDLPQINLSPYAVRSAKSGF